MKELLGRLLIHANEDKPFAVALTVVLCGVGWSWWYLLRLIARWIGNP